MYLLHVLRQYQAFKLLIIGGYYNIEGYLECWTTRMVSDMMEMRQCKKKKCIDKDRQGPMLRRLTNIPEYK